MQIFNSISSNSELVRSFSKAFLFQAIHFIQTILIQLIQFSISTYFVYTQLNVKTVPY